jgi:hypothetical protein
MSAPTMEMPHMLVLRIPAIDQYKFSQLAALSPVQWAVHLPAPGKVDLHAAAAGEGTQFAWTGLKPGGALARMHVCITGKGSQVHSCVVMRLEGPNA